MQRKILAVSVLAMLATNSWAQTTEAATTLDDVVVSATGYEQKIKNAPASITVISEEELTKKNYTSVAEALSDVPGVDIRNGASKTGVLGIEMRGMPSNYTLILIDGRRQNTSGSIAPNGFDSTMQGFLPPMSAIARIEVVRGPMSTLYGSDALGGVVNIITKPISSGEWHGNVKAQATIQQDRDVGDSRALDIYTSGPIVADKLGIEVRGRFFNRDGSKRLYENATGRDPRAGRSDNYDLGTKLSWDINDDNSLWVDLNTSKQWYDNKDSRLGTLDTYKPNGEPNKISGYKDKLTFLRNQYAIGHKLYLGSTTVETTLSKVDTETKGRTLPKGNVPALGYVYKGGEDRKLKNTDIIFQSKALIDLDEHAINAGFEYQNNKTVDAAAGQGNSFKQNSWALFAEDTWRFVPQLALTFGTRYEHHKTFGGEWTPRAYLVWDANEQWTFKGGVSTGYKVPTSNQLHDGINGFTAQGKTATIGSPSLKPEKSINYELSANYTNDKLDLTATAFLNQLKDKISKGNPIANCDYAGGVTGNCISLGGFPTQKEFDQNVNLDKAQSKGLELTGKYQVTPDWQLKGSYTWMKTEVKSGAEKGQYFVNVPRNALNLTSTYQFNERLNAWAGVEYKSSRKRFGAAPTSKDNIEIAKLTDNKFKGYTVVNLGMQYQINKDLNFTAGIDNVLDKKFDKAKTFVNSNGEEQVVYDYSNGGRSNEGTYIDRRKLWMSLSYDF